MPFPIIQLLLVVADFQNSCREIFSAVSLNRVADTRVISTGRVMTEAFFDRVPRLPDIFHAVEQISD